MSLAKKIANSLPAGAGAQRPVILSTERKTQEPRTKNPKAKPPGGRGKVMAYRSINDSFWMSAKVRKLSSEAKLVYLYLITVATNAGLVVTVPEIIAASVGIETGRVGGVLEELRGVEAIFDQPDRNLIWVAGQIDHQTIEKGGIDFYKARGLQNELQNLPEGIIRQSFERKYGKLLKNALSTGHKRPLDAPSTPPPIKERKLKEIKGNKDGRRETPTSDFKIFTAWYFEEWEKRFKAKPNWNGADGKNLKALLVRFSLEDIKAHCLEYFNNPDWHSQQNGQSFRNFCAIYDKITTRMTSAEWQPAKERQYDPQ